MAGRTDFKLQVIRQGGLYIAYSHTLDMSTTGKSEEQARANFAELALVYERIRPGAGNRSAGLAAELLKSGWTQKRKRWTSPASKIAAAEAKRLLK